MKESIGGDALIETIGQLSPGATLTAGEPDPAAGEVRAGYALVPSAASPRMLVPLGPPGARAGALRRFSADSPMVETALRCGAAGAARWMPGMVLRDRVFVQGGGPSLGDHLGELLGGPVSFSLTVGPPRVNRKPVLEVFDESGRSVAFAKLGLSDQAALDVRAEGRALTEVAARSFPRLVPPSVIARTRWQDRPLLVLQALRPSAWRRPGARWSCPHRAMAELADAFAEPDQPLGGTDWWIGTWTDCSGIEDPVVRGRFGRCLEQVADIAGDRPLRWGAWHGDWTPWNMGRDGRRVLLWDWERFETGVPRGLDRLHYYVNALTSRDGSSPSVILTGITLAQRADLRPGSEAHLMGALYLAAVTGRYLGLTDGPDGSLIAGRADDTLLALEQLCDGSDLAT